MLAFAVQGVAAGTTRTLTVPNADTTIVGTDVAQILTRKTLQAAGSGDIAAVVKAASSQIAPLLVLQDSNGDELLRLSSDINANTWLGFGAGAAKTSNNDNTGIGYAALEANTTGAGNTAVGSLALVENVSGDSNTAVGLYALSENLSGHSNTAVGESALMRSVTGDSNIALGMAAMSFATGGSDNTAVGVAALQSTTSDGNTAVGSEAMRGNESGEVNTAIGARAMQSNSSGDANTALGYQALHATNFSNTTGVGANSAVTGNNQIQLGDSATTTFAFGAVQNRSDLRDKTDIRDTMLGLEFVRALRPVDFRWDFRDDYRPQPPSAPMHGDSTLDHTAYATSLEQWRTTCNLSNITRDGSKARSRYHHGLVAQEVAEAIKRIGIDFGGYQDHAINGGDDVLSLGYEELIAPLIKAVQELAERNDELKARIAVLEKTNES